jgi:putative transposase
LPCWRLLYHVVWATAKRESLLVNGVERIVERSIRAGCLELGLVLHALSVMPDHVHVAVSIPPKHSVSSVVGKLKGSASHLVNHADEPSSESRFSWQSEYGDLSFGSKALPQVVDYIENQHRHHADHRLWQDLERTDDRE